MASHTIFRSLSSYYDIHLIRFKPMKIRVTSVIFTLTEITAIRVRPEHAVCSVVQFKSSDDLHYDLEIKKNRFS